MRVCAYLIVRNEAVLLPYALKSIESVCDEIFVVDNGSTDGTPEIAKATSDKVRLLYVPGKNGGGFADPDTPEDMLRNIGLNACKGGGADVILRWDADEILYEGQEERIRTLIEERSYGGWWFCCHRFVGSLDWVQDLRWGEPGCSELHKTIAVDRWGRQALHGKIVLLRNHPRLKYLRNSHYIGLHSSEYETAEPHQYRICNDIWYAHLEWARSNKRLYDKAILYYNLIADPNDYARSWEFQSQIDPEHTLKEQRLRPFHSELPEAMKGLVLPVDLKTEEFWDERSKMARRRIVKRTWKGGDW